MSDQDQPAPGEPAFDDPAFDDPAFDDPAFDDLRALLAETRVGEPIPADVAARLDATLSSLRDQRRGDAARPDGSVLVFRRRVGRVLVAAAAIAVVAAGSFGIVQSARNGSDSADSASSVTADEGDADKAAPLEPPTERQPEAVTGSAGGITVDLTSAHFARDAATAMRTLSTTAGTLDTKSSTPSTAAPSPTSPSDTGSDFAAETPAEAPPITATPAPLTRTDSLSAAAGCSGPAVPDAVTLPATLDGVPVALVFRPPTASEQVVEAWSCDGASLLASATVPH